MWKRKEEEKPVASPAWKVPFSAVPEPDASAKPFKVSPKEVYPVESSKPTGIGADVATIGKSVVVKGELSGSEDLVVDGEVEGSIELSGQALVIGPNGRVHANIHARDVIIHGKVEGAVRDAERVELKKSAVVVGDIFTQRIAIEEGAFFKGGIDLHREAKEAEPGAKVPAAPLAPAIAVAGSGQGALPKR